MYYLHFYSSNEKQLFTKIFSTRKNIVYTIRGGIYKRGKEKTRIRIAYLHFNRGKYLLFGLFIWGGKSRVTVTHSC